MLGHFPDLIGHLIVLFLKSNLRCKKYVHSVVVDTLYHIITDLQTLYHMQACLVYQFSTFL